ncbi:MAG TPA: alpha-L-fucosidase [Parafilimonas sp.]|nr:alpha-L-fucosidase [Parafilimonas sp.]
MKSFKFLIIVLTMISCAHRNISAQPNESDKTFFTKPRFGVIVHFLYQLQNENPEWNDGKKTSWDSCVNDFNVQKFANQLAEIKADYVIFTIHQKTQYMCIPNEAFEKITGLKRGEATSNIDLIAKLSRELQKRNIKLFLYIPGDGPYGNTFLRDKFTYGFTPGGTLKINQNYLEKWTSVIKEISLRYKDKVTGWWVDGCDPSKGFNNAVFKQLEDAMKAGNPKALVAFNYAYDKSPYMDSSIGDYSAGEEYNLKYFPSKDSVVPQNKYWHISSFVGKSWTSSGIRFTDNYLSKYMSTCLRSGSVTLGVAINRNGEIQRDQLGQLVRTAASRKR